VFVSDRVGSLGVRSTSECVQLPTDVVFGCVLPQGCCVAGREDLFAHQPCQEGCAACGECCILHDRVLGSDLFGVLFVPCRVAPQDRHV